MNITTAELDNLKRDFELANKFILDRINKRMKNFQQAVIIIIVTSLVFIITVAVMIDVIPFEDFIKDFSKDRPEFFFGLGCLLMIILGSAFISMFVSKTYFENKKAKLYKKFLESRGVNQ